MVYVFADPATQTPRPVPVVLRELFAAYEAGAPTIEIQRGTWQELGERAAPLRRSVFMEELGIPAPLDHDAADAAAVHVLVSNRLGQPLATGRLVHEADGVARIARVAVVHTMRATGIGRTLVQSLVRAAAERGDAHVVLQSQRSAEAFYLRLGFAPIAPETLEAGIPHVEMARATAGV
jgi:predicted GNAT family N-acyltransferase